VAAARRRSACRSLSAALFAIVNHANLACRTSEKEAYSAGEAVVVRAKAKAKASTSYLSADVAYLFSWTIIYSFGSCNISK
jgi:hypothetical protein